MCERKEPRLQGLVYPASEWWQVLQMSGYSNLLALRTGIYSLSSVFFPTVSLYRLSKCPVVVVSVLTFTNHF